MDWPGFPGQSIIFVGAKPSNLHTSLLIHCKGSFLPAFFSKRQAPVWLVVLFLLSMQFSRAQSSNYLFHRLGVRDGLLQENASSVCQDKRGFLWMSFRNGIQRYDGYRFLNFITGNGILPAGMITTMAMDSKGRLWIMTNYNTVGYFDTDKFSYHTVKVNLPASFANAPVGMNFGDGSNIMLIYLGRGLLTFSEKANEFSQQYNQFNLPVGYEPKHVVYGSDKNYWIATGNGFAKYNTQKKLLSYAGHNSENDAFINTFGFVKDAGVIYTDSLGRIWFSYIDNGSFVRSFNPANGEIKEWGKIVNESLKGAYFNVWGVSHFSDGSLWLSGMGLLARVNYEQGRIEQVISNLPGEYSIRYDVIGSLFEDREKSIWVFSWNK
jgi:ligand-binding sensor domain-containing protein